MSETKGRIDQLRGKVAEQRVANLAKTLGATVKPGGDEDFRGKTDLFINENRVQVSCTGKSRATRKSLFKRGITHVVAGEQVNDSTLTQIIKGILGLT
jgi:hypothetical protein